MAPPRPPKTSRAPLWIGLGALALFGSCGTCAAIGAMLPDPPKSSAAASDADDSLGDAIGGSRGGPALRDDVPRPAAELIQQARAAIAGRDHGALQKLLVADYGSFEVADDLEATTARTAIKGWKKNPKMLGRIDRALTEPCDIDHYDDGHVLIMCGRERDGSTFVILSNMIDDYERRNRYRISGVGTVD